MYNELYIMFEMQKEPICRMQM